MGASRKFTASYSQFQALQAVNRSISLNILTKDQVTIQFRIRASTSIKIIDINSPIGKV